MNPIADVQIGDYSVMWFELPCTRAGKLQYRFMLLAPVSRAINGFRPTVACGNARGITTSKAGKWSAHLRVDAGDRLPAGMTGPILDALEAAL